MRAVEDGDAGHPVLSLRWRFSLADRTEHDQPQEFASAAESDRFQRAGRIYVGSNDGTLYALETADARRVWKQEVGAVSSRPLVHRGRVYVGTDDGTLYCIDEMDGSIRWQYESRGAILEPPVVVEDSILFANEADHVYALDRQTGDVRWQYKIETPEEFTLRGHAGITLLGDLAVTGFSDGSLVALRAASGTVAWAVSLKEGEERFTDVDSTPVLVDNVLYATSSATGLHAVSAEGEIVWQVKAKGAGPVSSDGDRLFMAAANEGLFAVDFGGNVLWRQGAHGGGEPARPVVSKSYVFFPLSDAGLFVAEKHSGRVVQYFDPGSGVSSPPTLIGDEMYVLSNGGTLYAFYADAD